MKKSNLMLLFFTKKPLLAIALVVFAVFGVQAQGATNAGTKTPISRAELLAKGENAAAQLATAEITDLVTATVAPKYADGKYYLFPSEFYQVPADKQLHILRNADRYVVLAEGATKPKTPMSRDEVNLMTPEKRALIEADRNIEIID